jgi:hypothetical protein
MLATVIWSRSNVMVVSHILVVHVTRGFGTYVNLTRHIIKLKFFRAITGKRTKFTYHAVTVNYVNIMLIHARHAV